MTDGTLTTPVSGDDHIRGPEDAQVTLVEYGDYECPYCGRAEEEVKDIRERTGNRVRLVFRHFPNRSVHPHARMAAEAAEAAGAQGKFWEMHDLLFANQRHLEDSDLLAYAQKLGLDLERFRRELDEHVHTEKINANFRDGLRSGVRGTPTWFINGQRYDGAWDSDSLLEAVRKPLSIRISRMSQRFTRMAASGGLMLLIFTGLALLLANSGLAEAYHRFWETHLEISLGLATLSRTLSEWVNEGLMAVFFFVLGLEIKREVTAGELADSKRAALPLAAAVGGMLVPAAIYLAVNASSPEAIGGWGIPVATDIAFTLGILTILGGRVPLSLKIFFTAMAIADDVGGILVIAIFYSHGISLVNLAIAAALLALAFVLNRWRVFSPIPYAVIGFGVWLAFLGSGVHATIAGVLMALTIPTRSPPNVPRLLAQIDTVLNRYEYEEDQIREQALVSTLTTILDRMEPPAQRLEHLLQPWTTYLILPIFALANAGVALTGGGLGSPVSLGIILGLVLGKPLGVGGFAWLAVRLGISDKPPDVGWRQLWSASFLAGIGFTISLFIAQESFADPALLASAKVAILIASVLAGIIGFGLLNLTSPHYDNLTTAEPVAAGD